MGRNNLETMSVKKIAIVDCNNFYVSCERLFNPFLNNKPTVVLSNNDGCVIARSMEIKELGVKMGQPLFKLDKDVHNKMLKFSSNYALYGDISDRISTVLRGFTPTLEIYSIDESFMDLSHVQMDDLPDYLRLIKSEVFRLTGIPVSVGVAPNKTLAKLMNWRSKKEEDLCGVCSYFHQTEHENDHVAIGEVWGIGTRWEKKLNQIGIKTIGQFKGLEQWRVKKMLSVVGLRTQIELKGDLVYKLETTFKKPKAVTSTRTFGRTVWQGEQVKDALLTFIEDCCDKLKTEGLKPRVCVVFVATNRFEEDYYVWSKKIHLYNPSNDTQSIWNEISPYFEEIPLRLWAKAGAMFHNLIDDGVEIKTLFKEEHRFQSLPKVKSKTWMTRRDFISPNWTTDWNEVPKLT